MSIFDSNTFTFKTSSWLSSVSDPAGVDCGSYTVDIAFNSVQPSSATVTFTQDASTPSLLVDFSDDTDSIGSWDLKITAKHTDY